MANAPILIKDTEAANRIFSSRPVITSDNLGWHGLDLEHRYYPLTANMPEVRFAYHIITIMCDAPATPKVIRSLNGKEWQDETRIGEPMIIPAGQSYGAAWHTPATERSSNTICSFITMAIDPNDFSTAIDQSQDPRQIELTSQFSKPDPLLHQLGLGLKGLVESGAQGSRLYAETLTHTIMVHLLQHYTNKPTKVKNYSDGLSSAKLKLMMDYIHSHLDQDLSLKELASLLQLSPHYFAHLFKQSMGVAPHQYVISQRVKRAQQLLKQKDFSIAEVAYQVGFSSQAHLNRHFKRSVGVTPGKYRRG